MSEPDSVDDYLRKSHRLTAHLIAETLGILTPSHAAHIIAAAHSHRHLASELLYHCYDSDARVAAQAAFAHRHRHHGYLKDYRDALAIVHRAIRTGYEPHGHSW